MLDMWNEQRPSAENQTTQRWFFLFCRQAVRFASQIGSIDKVAPKAKVW